MKSWIEKYLNQSEMKKNRWNKSEEKKMGLQVRVLSQFHIPLVRTRYCTSF